MGAQEQDPDCDAGTCRAGIILCVLAILGLMIILSTQIFLSVTSKDPVYSVTITSVAGLDPTANPASPLSPVFNLTVHIDNAGNKAHGAACIGRLSTASVSYQDALLARGSVPEFCAMERKVQQRSTRAWGKDVDLPQFLRDQLAGELATGEAAIDIKMTTPAEFVSDSDTVFICSQAKIGGGPATCRKERVANHGQQATAHDYVV